MSDTWQDLDERCKAETGFTAPHITVAVWAEELDPEEKGEWDEAAEALSNIIGSSGDTHSRSAAVGIIHRLNQMGYEVTTTWKKPIGWVPYAGETRAAAYAWDAGRKYRLDHGPSPEAQLTHGGAPQAKLLNLYPKNQTLRIEWERGWEHEHRRAKEQ